MKITKRIHLLCLMAVLCSAQQPAKQRDIMVYTTAEKTEYRLTRTVQVPFYRLCSHWKRNYVFLSIPKKPFRHFSASAAQLRMRRRKYLRNCLSPNSRNYCVHIMTAPRELDIRWPGRRSTVPISAAEVILM